MTDIRHPGNNRIRESEERIFYRGRSMRGTFRNGDFLKLERVKPEDLRPGDVVVYRRKDKPEEMVVHRVISVWGEQIRTRGDYNIRADVTDPDPPRLIGRVTGFERHGSFHPVANGPAGRRQARKIRVRLFIRFYLLKGLRPSYTLLKKSRIVPFLWKPLLREVRFQSEGRSILKYLHRGKTIFRWDGKRLWIKKPYDLLFEVRSGTGGKKTFRRIH